MNFEISFKGMDKELNDDLYERYFPDYVHLLMQVIDLYDSLNLAHELVTMNYQMSWCGKTHYMSGYYERVKAGDLDPDNANFNYEKTTCPSCIDRFALSSLGALP